MQTALLLMAVDLDSEDARLKGSERHMGERGWVAMLPRTSACNCRWWWWVKEDDGNVYQPGPGLLSVVNTEYVQGHYSILGVGRRRGLTEGLLDSC